MFKSIAANRRTIFAAVPIIGCNATAFIGQLFFLRAHAKTWPLIGIVMLAGTMESIALFLASEAAEREKKGDASFNIRMASYGFGLFIGLINYSHYALPGFKPTVFSVIFGSMSALSPWLWAIYGRGIGRETLITRGLIEPRSVKFARVRWMMWPKETFRAFRLSAWTGTRDPEQAMRDYEHAEAAKREERRAIEEMAKEERRAELTEDERAEAKAEQARKDEENIRRDLEAATSKADAVRVALRYAPEGNAKSYVAWLNARGIEDVTDVYVRQLRASEARREADEKREGIHAV